MPHIPEHPALPTHQTLWPQGQVPSLPGLPNGTRDTRPRGPAPRPAVETGTTQLPDGGTFTVTQEPLPPGIPGYTPRGPAPRYTTKFVDQYGNTSIVENATAESILARQPGHVKPVSSPLGDIQETLKGIQAGGGRQTRALGGTVPDLVAQQDPSEDFMNFLTSIFTSIFGPQGAQSLLRELFAGAQPPGDLPLSMTFR
jgi:hypothetical protein